jgi:hypothetical protein
MRGLDPRIHQKSLKKDGLPGIGWQKRRCSSNGYARQ